MPRPHRSFAIAFVSALLVICILIFSMTMNNIASVSAIEAEGVGVYWDRNCRNGVSSIDWGTFKPGSVKNVVVYIRNEVEEPVYPTMSTTNWNPSKASEYITFRWNYSARGIAPDEVLQITLTLSISRYIEGITNFSFDILVTGSDRLLGDVDGDGKVTSLDVKKVRLAISGYLVEPRADLDGDGFVTVLDLKKVKLILGGYLS